MPSGFLFLEGEIFVLIFFKIRRFGLEGDSLTRIIGKFAALAIHGNDAFFDAKTLLVIQLCTVLTVAAGLYHPLPKEHLPTSVQSFSRLYTIFFGNATSFFGNFIIMTSVPANTPAKIHQRTAFNGACGYKKY